MILLVGITFLSFLLSWLSPGDAAERMLKKSGMMVTEEQLEAKREELGLNKPLLIQYKDWMINLCKGDLGTSYKSKKEVAAELAKNLPYTAALTAVSMLLVVLIVFYIIGGIVKLLIDKNFKDMEEETTDGEETPAEAEEKEEPEQESDEQDEK